MRARDKIRYVMKRFPFDRLSITMATHKWKWSSEGFTAAPPTPDEIRKALHQFLQSVVSAKEKPYGFSCGGLKVGIDQGRLSATHKLLNETITSP